MTYIDVLCILVLFADIFIEPNSKSELVSLLRISGVRISIAIVFSEVGFVKVDKGLLGGSTNLMLLSLLSESDKYGYEIIRELERRSDRTFQLQEGTLYPVLHKLKNNGYVKSYMGTGSNGRKRKYYRITNSGVQQLAEEKKRWKVFSVSVNKVLGSEVRAFG